MELSCPNLGTLKIAYWGCKNWLYMKWRFLALIWGLWKIAYWGSFIALAWDFFVNFSIAKNTTLRFFFVSNVLTISQRCNFTTFEIGAIVYRLMDCLRILFKTKSDRFVEKRAYVFGNMSLEQIIEQVHKWRTDL